MLKTILRTMFSMLRSRETLILENAVLRHQIEVLQRNSTRPALRWRDRAFWDILSCLWPDWRRSLFIVQPDTVVKWHLWLLFIHPLCNPRTYAALRHQIDVLQRNSGRPRVSREIPELIRQMSQPNKKEGQDVRVTSFIAGRQNPPV